MTINDIIKKFNTVPFLFVGSGITRRYYNLPDWKGLLKSFAEKISNDRFAYTAYESKAKTISNKQPDYPLIAELIQKDFDEAWFEKEDLRTLDSEMLDLVENGVSPFKAEIANMVINNSIVEKQYDEEIEQLKIISANNIAGIITTNYDTFFESIFKDYKTFIGQDELVFSSINGIAEIYKIHGSVTKPDSIVINSDDYINFNNKGKYLAAKLMTIFMEYPIVFMGYSITDENIRNILSDIVECLPEDKIEKLQERFVFIDWKEDIEGYSIDSHSIDLNGKLLRMNRISLSDYSLLYNALSEKKAAIPVKVLRRFKEDLYTYAITNEPGPTLFVAPIDNENLNTENLAISIGLSKNGEFGLKRMIDTNRWYQNIVLDDLSNLGYTYDQFLELAYPSILRENNGYIPVCKYLSKATKEYPEIKAAIPNTYDDLLTNTNKKTRYTTEIYKSVKDLWEKEKSNPKKACRLITCLPGSKVDASELEEVLKELFEMDKDLLSNKERWVTSDIKRIIRIFDYVKWKEKEPV